MDKPTVENGANLLELLDKAKAGDEEAFAQLWIERYPRYRAWLGKRFPKVLAPTDPSDVLMAGFMRVFKKFQGHFRGSTLGEFDAWCRTVIRREIPPLLDQRYAAKRHPDHEQPAGSESDPHKFINDHPDHLGETPFQIVSDDERRQRLTQAVDRIPDPTVREVIRLWLFERNTVTAIAAGMGLDRKTVGTYIERWLPTVYGDSGLDDAPGD